jgi:hypothetical protein
MELQVIDPVTAAPVPASGVGGKLITSLPANAMAITPDDNTFFRKPVQVWVGDAGPVDVTVVPYGLEGDKSVTYPGLTLGMTIPVLCSRVKSTGTTATILRGHF